METDTARALPSHGIFTCALPDGLRYVSAGDLRDSFLAEPVIRIEAIERKLDTLLETDDSSAIENFREILGFLEGLTDDERLAARLADIGSRLDDLSDTISSKQDALETSPDLTLTDGHILSLTDLAKAHLFCDLFNQAAGEHGHAEVVDGVFSCMLNGLELTYGEAVEIYMAGGPDSIACAGKYGMTHIRTHLPPRLYSGNNYTSAPKINGNFMFYRMDNLEVANLSGLGVESVYCMFQHCPKLREIIGVFSMLDSRGERSNMFFNCPELVEFRVMQMNKDMSLEHSPKISLATFEYMVRHRMALTSMPPFTLTVHPDVYAKLTGDTTNEAAAALTEEELAKWAQLLSDAAEKEITFTIPN